MRLVLLIPKLNAPAELALNELLKQADIKITGIIRSNISPLNKTYWKYMMFGVKQSGPFYGLMIAIMAYFHWIGVAIASLMIWRRRRKWLTTDQLVKKHQLKVHDTTNINSKKTIEALKNFKPDVIVSLYFDQILKKEAISIAKSATINMHPGILPKYRGIWPNFWKLYNNEKNAGVTIHTMIEKIDEGDIIAQIQYPIKKGETALSLNLKTARHGAKLLIKTLRKIKTTVPLPILKKKGISKYYTLPTKQDFELFKKKGNQLFSIRNCWRYIFNSF
jgi:folate-dependent phosphoribosylglycinamide formyltransferase PurN